MQTLTKAEPIAVLGIDPGWRNLLTCVDTTGNSFLVEAREFLGITCEYDTIIETIESEAYKDPFGFELAAVLAERERVLGDAAQRIADFVVSHCLEHDIKQIAFGDGNFKRCIRGQRKQLRQATQKLFEPPIGWVRRRVKDLCSALGIAYSTVKEDNTSRASFWDRDDLPPNNAPNWHPSGRRSPSGKGYQTAEGCWIHADCNGAANLIRKAAIELGLTVDLSAITLNTLKHPHQVRLSLA